MTGRTALLLTAAAGVAGGLVAWCLAVATDPGWDAWERQP